MSWRRSWPNEWVVGARIAALGCLVCVTGCSLLFSISDDAARGQADAATSGGDSSDADGTDGADSASSDGGGDSGDSARPTDGGNPDACADPYWSNVVLLVRFEPPVTAIDESGRNHFVGFVGVQRATFASRSAGAFSGDASYLLLNDDPDWNFGSGDFTIEAQVNTNAAAPQAILNQWQDTGPIEERAFSLSLTGASSTVDFQGPNAGISLTSSGGIGGGTTFHHVAVVRTNGMALLYVDGVRAVSTSAAGALSDSTQHLYIGRYAGTATQDFSGYLDDIRITKGVARYTAANITPPAELPVCP